MTRESVKNATAVAISYGRDHVGTTLKAFAGFGLGGICLYVLYVLVTTTGPETAKAMTADIKEVVGQLRNEHSDSVNKSNLSHEKTVERSAVAFEKAITVISGEIKEDRAMFRDEMREFRNDVTDKLDEGNELQKQLFKKLLGLREEPKDANGNQPLPALPPAHP